MSSAPHDKLARWLAESSDGAPEPAPEGLEPDVVEAVYALRPDLAPPPRVDIDDILAELTEGPLAPSPEARAEEARAAAAFAALLDAGADADLDGEDLDGDAVEALLALQPERAPAPQLSIDDIFAAVTEGPFAQPDNVVALPTAAAPAPAPAEEPAEAEEPEAEVVDLSARRRAWWTLPGLGALAAAAAALMVVQPISLNESQPLDMALDGARYEEAAPAPTSAPLDGDFDPATAKRSENNRARFADQTGGDTIAAAEKPKDALAPEEPTDLPSADPEPEPEPEPEREPMPEPAASAAPKQQSAPMLSARPSAGAASAPMPVEESNEMPAEVVEQLSALGYVSADANTADASAESKPEPEPMSEPLADRGEMLSNDDMLDSYDYSSAAEGGVEELQRTEDAPVVYDESVSATSGRSVELWRPSRRNGGLFGGAERADAPTAPAGNVAVDSVAEMEMEEEIEEEAEDAVSMDFDDAAEGPVTMTTLRTRAARAFESAPSVVAAHPELAAVYAEVDALVAAGNIPEALERLDGMRRAAEPDIVMDVAWRRCDLYLRRGLVVPATAALDEGLQVVGGDPRLRARLLYQKGQLLERRGDVTGATAAYQEAARLR